MARIFPFSSRRTRRRGSLARPAGAILLLAAAAGAAFLQGGGPPVRLPGAAAAAEIVAGRPRVVDGDTLAFGDERVRILDIDAPETNQSCLGPEGRAYACGETATRALLTLVGEDEVRCESAGRDVYGRMLARCEAEGRDLGAAMIRAGWAVIYRKLSDAYAPEEAAAQAENAGMWAGRFDFPWDHRDGADAMAQGAADVERVLEEAKGPGECLIKGNVSDGGRIYHVPGARSYERTKIAPERGERWFCSEEEAEAAGWRAPRR